MIYVVLIIGVMLTTHQLDEVKVEYKRTKLRIVFQTDSALIYKRYWVGEKPK
jgi:hypothetical protein